MSRIRSVDAIENVGLVHRDAPVEIRDGLTVFYGKNAAGKSSIFSALVNTLGISKRAAPNLGGTDQNLACTITVDANGEPKELKWSGKAMPLAEGVRVLDSDTCLHLVEKEQANNFELAHLRTEYFDFLADALEELSIGLDGRKSSTQAQYDSLKTAVQASIPNIESLEKWLRGKRSELESAEFLDGEATELDSLESKLATLEQNDPALGAKRLEAATRAARSILEILGKVTSEEMDSGEVEIAWSQSVGAGADALNAAVAENKALLRVTEQTSIASLAGSLPDNWAEKQLWRDFIVASLAFVSSLGSDEAEQYTNDACPLCLQPLASPEAKALLTAYRALEGEQFKNLEESNAKLDRAGEDLVAVARRLQDLPANLELVNTELAARPGDDVAALDVAALAEYLNVQARAVKAREEVSAAPDSVTEAGAAGDKLVAFWNTAQGQIGTLRGQAKDRAEEVRQVKASLERLRLKKKLVDCSSQILEMFECADAEQKLQDRATSLTQLKRAISTARTAFSRDEPLAAFRSHLEEEYRRLRYQPPPYWSLTSRSGSSGNVRVYSLGDRRLSEIFSEGERKIHAIADFLAEAELNDFHGVYIFDDPVNSLDEERMECVANRILDLVGSGHQVVVFTHNIFFLNMLVDPVEEKIVLIERLESAVHVEPEILLGDANEMSKRMKTIDKRLRTLSDVPEHEREEYALRNLYDLMSGYLEAYFEQKILFNVINRYRANLRMHSLDRLRSIDGDKLSQLQSLYGKTSRKGSRHSQPRGSVPPTYDELCEHVEVLRVDFKF